MFNKIKLCKLTSEDVHSIFTLSEDIEWFFTMEEVKSFIMTGSVFGHKIDNKLISTAAIFNYGTLASIGTVMVNPNWQRRGLGLKLMNRCLSEININKTVVTLISTKEGIPLYNFLGFKTVGRVKKMIADSNKLDNKTVQKNLTTRPIELEDLEKVISLDFDVTGGNRRNFYYERLRFMYKGIVITNSNDSHILGFGISICRHNLLIIGPVIAKEDAHALYIIQQLASGWKGPIRIDIPETQNTLINTLTSQGYNVTEIIPVLTLEGKMLPGDRSKLYAIASQAFS